MEMVRVAKEHKLKGTNPYEKEEEELVANYKLETKPNRRVEREEAQKAKDAGIAYEKIAEEFSGEKPVMTKHARKQ